MITRVNIKSTTTVLEKELFFDPNIFLPLKITNEKEWQEKITRILAAQHFDELPFRVLNIFQHENNQYRLIVKRPSGFFVPTVDLTKQQEDLANKVSLDFSQVDRIPMGLEVDATIHQGYIADCEKEEAKQFVAGKIFKPFLPPPAPALRTIAKDEHSFDKTAQFFPQIKSVVELQATAEALAMTISTLQEGYNKNLVEWEKISPDLVSFATKAFLPLEVDALAESLENKKTEIMQIVGEVSNELQERYTKYVTTQAQIDFLERCLVWGIYEAQGKYYEDIQKETTGNRAERIESFNRHFKGFAQIEGATLTNFEEVFKRVCAPVSLHASLDQADTATFTKPSKAEDTSDDDEENLPKLTIKQRMANLETKINLLIGKECNTSWLRKSEKQVELKNGVEKAATVYQQATGHTSPFTPQKELLKGVVKKTGFSWGTTVTKLIDEMATEERLAATTGEEARKSVEQINFNDETGRIRKIETEYIVFLTKVTDHEKLIKAQLEAANLKQDVVDKINPVTKQGEKEIDWLTQIQDSMLTKLTDIENLQPSSIIEEDSSEQATKEEIEELVSDARSRIANIDKLAKKLAEIKRVRPRAKTHLDQIAEDLQELKNAHEELCAKKEKLLKRAETINEDYELALIEAKRHRLGELRDKLERLNRHLSNFPLNAAESSTRADVQTLVQACRQNKGAIAQLYSAYAEQQLQEPPNFLAQLQQDSQSADENYARLETHARELCDLLGVRSLRDISIQPPEPPPVSNAPVDSPSPVTEPKATPENTGPSFLQRHWKKILLGIGIGLLVGALGGVVSLMLLATAGTVAAISIVAGGAAVGAAAGAGVGAVEDCMTPVDIDLESNSQSEDGNDPDEDHGNDSPAPTPRSPGNSNVTMMKGMKESSPVQQRKTDGDNFIEMEAIPKVKAAENIVTPLPPAPPRLSQHPHALNKKSKRHSVLIDPPAYANTPIAGSRPG